ncbi:radical SAM protein [Pseudomonas syringae pv. actinidiae]|nr:radical SAM protein [Pseudomonas syringae pv. actinidiae]
MNEHIDKNNPRNTSPDFDHLFYLRIFEGCNLHCDHCFIPSNPKKMQISDFEHAASQIERVAAPGQNVLIQWHGGEPTALGPKYFRQAIETIDASKGARNYIYGIQTNLMTYSDEWKSIYQEYFDSNIGVSWDFGIRKTKVGSKSNAEYEDVFWVNFERMLSDGIKPYVVITATKVLFEHFKNPFDLFDYLVSRGITHVHFERITKTGYARENWDVVGLSNKQYSEYMAAFYRAYVLYSRSQHTRDTLFISPFDGLKDSVVRLKNGGSGGYGCLSGACDTRFHTIDSTGYKKGCTALTSEYDNKASGENVIFFSDFKMARKLRQVDCTNCEFKTICSSGCLATDKSDGSGECSGAYTLFKTISGFV